jgi:hypothetical protein
MNKPILQGLWFFVAFWGVGVIVLGMSGFQLDSYKLVVLRKHLRMQGRTKTGINTDEV